MYSLRHLYLKTFEFLNWYKPVQITQQRPDWHTSRKKETLKYTNATEKAISLKGVEHLDNEFPTFHDRRQFITLFTTAHHGPYHEPHYFSTHSSISETKFITFTSLLPGRRVVRLQYC